MRIFRIALLTTVLAGCAVGPDYRRPAVDLPTTYNQPDIGEQKLATDWWTLYQDPVLNDLVASALAHNADIRQAVARVEEAEAALRETTATLLPEVDLVENSNKSRSSILTATPLPPGTPILRKDHKLTLSTSFELDFWGKLRRAAESARAATLATRYAKDVTALTVAGTTAQIYFALRSLDAQVAVTRELLSGREEALEVVKRRAAGGLASDLDVNQATAARADAAIQLKDLQRQRSRYEHQLGSLTGKPALQLSAGDIGKLPLPPLPPAGLPATLLERRPDVRQAEQSLIAANAQIGVARAAQFPTFSLTGSYGGESQSFHDIFKNDARTGLVGLGFVLPIIDSGKYAARTEQAEARQHQAAAMYQKTVETAFREVADALTDVQQSAAIEADQQARLAAANVSLNLARERYEAGYSPYLEVLDAQRTANDAALSQIRSRQSQLAFSVDLMKALGGGWTPGQIPQK